MEQKPHGLTFWLPIITSAAAAVWTLVVFFTTNTRADKFRAEDIIRADQTRAAQYDLERKVEQLRTYGHQLDLIPHVIDLLKEQDCASDFLALTLLKETRSLIDSDTSAISPGGIGLAATRATFRLLSARQEGRPVGKPYCSCTMLQSIKTDYVWEGRDQEASKLAATVVDIGARSACPPKEAAVLEKSVDLQGQGYSVVFVNSNDCAILNAVYKKALTALSTIGEAPGRLAIASGKGRKQSSQVVEFGNGTLTFEQASGLVPRLRGQQGIRDDIYWAHKLTFSDKSECPAPP